MFATLMAAFTVTIKLGIPVFLTMGIATFVAFLTNPAIAMTQIPQLIFRGLNSFPVMAIPLFIMAADIMTEGKLSDLLIKMCDDFLGHVTGGLGNVSVVMSMLFGAISGSAMACAAGPGKLVMFMMRDQGYDKYYSGALTAVTAAMGMLIPPSIPMVIYSLSDGRTSTIGLFIAGYIPGFMAGMILIAANMIISRKHGYKFKDEKAPWKNRIKSLVRAIPALLMPVIIIGFTVSGITTPTEAASVAVFYSIMAGLFITRSLTFKLLYKAIVMSAVVSAAILMIVGMGALFSWVLTFLRVPQMVAGYISVITTNPVIILFLIAAFVIVIGMFLDPIPAVMILGPIASAIGADFGIHPLHTAMVVIMCISIGMLTPPLAPLLFVTSSIGKLRLEKLIVATLPLLTTLFIVLVFVILFPPLTTWLPGLLGFGS